MFEDKYLMYICNDESVFDNDKTGKGGHKPIKKSF